MYTDNKTHYEVPMIEIVEFSTENSIADSGANGVGFFEEIF